MYFVLLRTILRFSAPHSAYLPKTIPDWTNVICHRKSLLTNLQDWTNVIYHRKNHLLVLEATASLVAHSESLGIPGIPVKNPWGFLGFLEFLRIPTESLRIPRQESLRIPDKNPWGFLGIPVDTRDPNLGIRNPNLGIPRGSLRCSWARIPRYKQYPQPRVPP